MIMINMQMFSVFDQKKIYYNSKEKLSCARCGCEISIHEHIKYCEILKVLGHNHVIHFCKACFDIRNR